MSVQSMDCVILGAGFGGCALAAVLARHGKRVAIIDRQHHPRFALGESTTPLGDRGLHRLGTEFDVPELLPLCSYGRMKDELPDLMCGRKRGFSYFQCDEATGLAGTRAMLVAASASDEHSDTHWLRQDIDHYVADIAKRYGAKLWTGADYRFLQEMKRWKFVFSEGTGPGSPPATTIEAPFVVDATGSANAVLHHRRVPDQTDRLRTNSICSFAHFRNCRGVGPLLAEAGVNIDDHPFDCDAAAVHHLLPDGWMWQLPFDDGTTSVGVLTDGSRVSARSHGLGPVWAETLESSPLLRGQFKNASICRPTTSLVTTGRLQRLAAYCAEDNWAGLPSTAGLIDPLHSTGIAHTISGVQRLAEAILEPSARDRLTALSEYSDNVIAELLWIDELVACCYAARTDFRLWADSCLLYFCVVTSSEVRGQSAGEANSVCFLNAGNRTLRLAFQEAQSRLLAMVTGTYRPEEEVKFRRWCRQRFQPWNVADLFRDEDEWMYDRTAAPPLFG